jgi:hypothetical protein
MVGQVVDARLANGVVNEDSDERRNLFCRKQRIEDHRQRDRIEVILTVEYYQQIIWFSAFPVTRRSVYPYPSGTTICRVEYHMLDKSTRGNSRFGESAIYIGADQIVALGSRLNGSGNYKQEKKKSSHESVVLVQQDMGLASARQLN